MKTTFSLACLFFFYSFTSYSQTVFDLTLTGENNTNAVRSICTAVDNGFILSEAIVLEETFIIQFIHLSEDGEVLQVKNIPEAYVPTKIVNFEDGYLVTARLNGSIHLFKIDENLNTVWANEYLLFQGDTVIEFINTQVVESGTAIITGNYYHEQVLHTGKLFTAKLSFTGEVLIKETYTSNFEASYLWDINTIPTQEGYLLTGNPFKSFGGRSCVVKLTSDLKIERIYETKPNSQATSFLWGNSTLEFVSDTTFVYCSRKNLANTGFPQDEDICVQLYDTAFNKLKEIDLAGEPDDIEYLALYEGIDFATDGSIYIGATSAFKYNMLTKLDTGLDVIWTKFYGGDASYWLTHVKATSDGGCIIVSNIFKNGEDSRDAKIIKVDADGNSSMPNGIESKKTQLTHDMIVYPSPTTGLLNYKKGPQVANAIIIFYDMVGKEVFREKVSSDSGSFNLSGNKNGTYIFKIFNESVLIDSGKIILVK